MNQNIPNIPKIIQLKLPSLMPWLILLGLVLLSGTTAFKWLADGFLILLAIVIILPIAGWFGLQWWLRRNLVESACPVCSYEFTGFQGTNCVCPSCGEPLQAEQGKFKRVTPAGTIDVEAVEVMGKNLED